MLAAVHGVTDRSISILITPWVVSNVTTWKPRCGGCVGGRPTSLTPGGSEGAGLAEVSKSEVQSHWAGPAVGLATGWEPPSEVAATIHTTSPMTTTTAAPAPR